MGFKVPDWAHDISTMSFWIMLIIIATSAFSATTIESSATVSQCNLGYCEPVPVTIRQTAGALPEEVFLRLDFTNNTGKMLSAKNYLLKGSNKFELTAPFSLPVGQKNFLIEYSAIGSGKFNVSIVGASSGTVYALLDPWWNSTWSNAKQLNFSATGTYEGDITFAAGMAADFRDLRFVNTTDNSLMNYWIEYWKNSTSAHVWINVTSVNAYMYYNNNAASAVGSLIGTAINGDEVRGTSINASIWTNSSNLIVNSTLYPRNVLQWNGDGTDNYDIMGGVNISASTVKYVYMLKTTGDGHVNVFPMINRWTPAASTANNQVRHTIYDESVMFGRDNTGTIFCNMGMPDSLNASKYFQRVAIFQNASVMNLTMANMTMPWGDGITTNSNTTSCNTADATYRYGFMGVTTNDYSTASYYLAGFAAFAVPQTAITAVFGGVEYADSTSPVVVNVAPNDSYYEQRNASNASTALLNFTYNASDNALSFCELWVNGSYKQNDTSPVNNTNQMIVNVNVTANVNTSWFMNCSDTAGNRGNSTLWYFYVNTTNYTGIVVPPVSNVTSVDSGIYLTTPSGSYCVNANTIRYYWTIGTANFTKDSVAPYGCLTITSGSAGYGVENLPEWAKWILLTGAVAVFAFVGFKVFNE